MGYEFRPLESRLICRDCHAVKSFRMPYQELYYHHYLKGNSLVSGFSQENKDDDVEDITEKDDKINNEIHDVSEYEDEYSTEEDE